MEYTYTQQVGGLCCYFGQIDRVIPQPGDNLLILGLCDCVKKVVAKLKEGETAVSGQALYMNVSDGTLTITPIANAFYGIAKEGDTATGADTPITVYVEGGFDIDQVVVDGGTVTDALALEARGRGIYFEQRV